jgi:predicted phage terminase large subunit-like protein
MLFNIDQIDEQAVTKAIAERSLKEFARLFWSVLEPGKNFVEGPHIDAICLHLESLTYSVYLGKPGLRYVDSDDVWHDTRSLLINIPPRCMKSLLVSVLWPCWVWTFWPESRWMYASYNQRLAERDSMKCRRIIESPLYRRLWGNKVTLRDDQNAKAKFENTQSGFRIATSTGGAATGEGADFCVVDDPHAAMDALSPTKMESDQIWFDETWGSRLNDAERGGMVVIMQRIGEQDLSGHIVRKGEWCHLMLPMEYEPERHCKTNLWEDWRKKDGELLWPDRVSAAALQKLKNRLGRYGVAGQLQQRPTPRGGGMFERHWFGVVKAAPAGGSTLRYWDRAGSENPDADWTAGLKMQKHPTGVFYIHGVARLQGSPLKVEQAIATTATSDGKGCNIRLEQDPGQAGKAEVGYHIRQLAGYVVKAVPVRKSKEARVLGANGVAAQAEAGNIKIVDPLADQGGSPWVKAFLDEICLFPRGEHDDQVDALSGAFNELLKAFSVVVA